MIRFPTSLQPSADKSHLQNWLQWIQVHGTHHQLTIAHTSACCGQSRPNGDGKKIKIKGKGKTGQTATNRTSKAWSIVGVQRPSQGPLPCPQVELRSFIFASM